MLAANKEDGHKGKGDDGHCGANGEIDTEIDIFYDEVGNQQ